MVYEDLIMTLFGSAMSSGSGSGSGSFIGDITRPLDELRGFGYGLINNAISYAQSRSNQRRAYNYARMLQEHQYDLTQRGYREGSSNIRYGLEKAGFNPMLAVNGGNAVGSANVAGGTPVSANQPDGVDAVNNAMMVRQQANNDIQTQSNVELNTSQSNKATAEAIGQSMENEFIPDKRKAEIANIQAQTSHFNAMIDNMQARIQLDRELGFAGLANNRDVAHIYANASKYGADVSAGASRYASDTGYNATTYRSWSDHLRNLGIGIGGITGVYRDLNGSDKYPKYSPRKSGNPRAYFDYDIP